MTRVKRGNVARKRRKKVLALAKGFRGSLSKLYRPAHQAVLKALSHSYVDRRRKKRDYRRLWIARVNGALSTSPISYAQLVHRLKVHQILLNRKVLADLAYRHQSVFHELVGVVNQEGEERP